MKKIIIGTRSSELALWQANFVKNALENKCPKLEVELKYVKTKGDKILDKALSKIGDKGLFTKELEIELLSGGIDIAVHSLKDMQTEMPAGLKIAAVTKRGNPEDALIARQKDFTLDNISKGATVATGSLRRKAQLLHHRPDLTIADLRGNVNTRLEKFIHSNWEAIILARAGLERINKDEFISSILPIKNMLPAVGQGALGIQIAESAEDVEELLLAINDEKSYSETMTERAFLRKIGGGCQTPIGAYATLENGEMLLDGMVCSLDGKQYFREQIISESGNPDDIGKQLARVLIEQGAKSVLK